MQWQWPNSTLGTYKLPISGFDWWVHRRYHRAFDKWNIGPSNRYAFLCIWYELQCSIRSFCAHQVCEIMGLCKAPTVSTKPVKSLIFEDRTKFSICDSCKDLVNSLRNALTDPANENFVANSLRKICVLIFPNDPTNFANCDTM